MFAEQVIMPASTSERPGSCVFSDLANRSPNWEVLIKPRIAPGDATFHDVDTHISTTLKQSLGVPPANLRLDYRPLPVLLKQARLLATLSSTASSTPSTSAAGRLQSAIWAYSRTMEAMFMPAAACGARSKTSPTWMPLMLRSYPRIHAGWSGWAMGNSSVLPPCSKP